MSEHTILRIPLLEDFYDELEDAFIDQKETAHDFVWGQMRALCADAKLGKLNRNCAYNIVKDGKAVQEIQKLRGFELEELPSNPDWKAKNMEDENVKYFEHSITDKTMEYLKLFSSFAILRFEKFGESIVIENERQLLKITDPKVIEETKLKQEEGMEKYKESKPTCIEECVFNAIFPQVYKHVADNVGKMFDKENEQMYPKEEAVKTA